MDVLNSVQIVMNAMGFASHWVDAMPVYARFMISLCPFSWKKKFPTRTVGRGLLGRPN